MREKVRVLIVDENEEFRKALKKLLSNAGYEVFICEDPREAIDQINEHQIELVLMERLFPDFCERKEIPDINGVELFDEMCRLVELDIKVIFIVAHGETESYMDAMNLGAMEYLEKPLKSRESLQKIANAFGPLEEETVG